MKKIKGNLQKWWTIKVNGSKSSLRIQTSSSYSTTNSSILKIPIRTMRKKQLWVKLQN